MNNWNLKRQIFETLVPRRIIVLAALNRLDGKPGEAEWSRSFGNDRSGNGSVTEPPGLTGGDDGYYGFE